MKKEEMSNRYTTFKEFYEDFGPWFVKREVEYRRERLTTSIEETKKFLKFATHRAKQKPSQKEEMENLASLLSNYHSSLGRLNCEIPPEDVIYTAKEIAEKHFFAKKGTERLVNDLMYDWYCQKPKLEKLYIN